MHIFLIVAEVLFSLVGAVGLVLAWALVSMGGVCAYEEDSGAFYPYAVPPARRSGNRGGNSHQRRIDRRASLRLLRSSSHNA